ncbi:hypothetical protein HY249_00750 [Candidatus Azambacteria bacterium]|nr:hypothetical protein [Candidatus Azambacteria bacterium]
MKRVNVSIIILLLALASASNAIAGSGYAIVIDVVPTMTKISKQEQIQKGTSGVGATGGGLAGTWVGFKWGGVPGAILGAGVGALSGNALHFILFAFWLLR